jgi:hypothetical protein
LSFFLITPVGLFPISRQDTTSCQLIIVLGLTNATLYVINFILVKY